MKIFKWYFLFIVIVGMPLLSYGQTIRQFNGRFDISLVKASGDKYEIAGNFSDLSSNFTANNVMVGDQIIDVLGNAYEIVTITSISGVKISAICTSLNGTFPSGGGGIIFRPTSNGYPLITNSTPDAVLNTVLNTVTLSVNSDLPTFQIGETLPSAGYSIGSVVLLSGKSQLFRLDASGWSQVTGSIPSSTATTISIVGIKPAGSLIYLFRRGEYYVSDGTAWSLVPTVTELPAFSKYGDVYYETAENKLYMMSPASADGSSSQWVDISGGGIPGGGAIDFPDSPTAGDLFFNTDNNTLYLYNIFDEWVEVSSNGSTPANMMNPDISSVSLKEGVLFYNTSTHQLYVFNGSAWIPVGNELADGQVFVGDVNNVATAVPLSGDAVISNTGSLTIKDQAITDSKLNKANIPLSGFGIPMGNISMGNGTKNYKIVNLLTPTDLQDAATKGYVDNLFANPSSMLSLPKDNFFVGNASGKATAVEKNKITLNGFGTPTDNISMGGKYLRNIPDVLQNAVGFDDVAVNKKYVDSQVIYPINIALGRAMILQGNEFNQAAAVETTDVPFSSFGAATANVSLGNFKLTDLAAPTTDNDATTKKYVDGLFSTPETSLALPSGNLFMGNAAGKAAAVAKNTIPLSVFGAATANLAMGSGANSYKITSLADPTENQDATTKKYVDDKVASAKVVLEQGKILVGDAAGQGAPVNVSGDATLAVDGKLTLADDAVSAANLNADVAGTGLKQNLSGALEVDVTTIPGGSISSSDLVVSGGSNATLNNVSLAIADKAVTESKLDKANIPLSGFGNATADIAVGNGTTNYKILNLATPTSADDASTAATKGYVDSALASASAGNLYHGTAADLAAFMNMSWAELSAATISGTSVSGTICTLSQSGFTWIAYPKGWGNQDFFYQYEGETYAVFSGFRKRLIPASDTGSVDYQVLIFLTTPDREVSLVADN